MKHLLTLTALLFGCIATTAADEHFSISIKQPGNPATTYNLTERQGQLVANKALPVTIERLTQTDGDDIILTLRLKAQQRIYYNLQGCTTTTFATERCDFYLPGFWYHQNMRSPGEAPSFKTSRSWNFREDRLSSPLTSVFDNTTHQGLSVMRILDEPCDALTTHAEGEAILSGKTSVGFLGFDNEKGTATLTFGYPYIESPRRYIRKLTLTPSITTFARLDKGETKTLRWRIRKSQAADFGAFVTDTWRYCFDQLRPQPIQPRYTPEQMKQQLTNFFRESWNDRHPLKFNSGLTILTDRCEPFEEMQIGFCGRPLLNAFNELEYGYQHQQQDLVDMGNAVFDSFLANGLSPQGYFHDFINYARDGRPDGIHSIRQQSEGIYAVLHYLRYEQRQGRQHKEWERVIRHMLDNFVAIQKADGSFARKFRDDGSDVDASCGSTPSATVPLVMGYKYFRDKRYLQAARRTIDYLERNIIAPSDYFSSTLDANCEDKEAAISAATATYYMALVTKGKERQRYIGLCQKAAYFALSWYYLWDVPFAPGQMLGDLGLQSRGWSNVSVENNHIDVFVFEMATIAQWLADETGEQRFRQMHDIIFSSLNQLLPTPERLCGIAKPGFYPEVVQHTAWDYGLNGKGFYNNLFAPGWTVASLWELYTPERTPQFLLK